MRSIIMMAIIIGISFKSAFAATPAIHQNSVEGFNFIFWGFIGFVCLIVITQTLPALLLFAKSLLDLFKNNNIVTTTRHKR